MHRLSLRRASVAYFGAVMATAIGCASSNTDVKLKPTSTSNPEKVLVVFSSADTLALKDGTLYTTGFYFPELMTPLKLVIEAGYEIDFANPRGNVPVMDKHSDSPSYFGGGDKASPEAQVAAQKEYDELWALCTQTGICGPKGSRRGTRAAKRLSDVVAAMKRGEVQYAGILVPGGHAPMQDLVIDPAYGELLREVADKKPLGLICHAPVSLVAAMPNPQAFIDAHVAQDTSAMQRQSAQWPFRSKRLAVFTSNEEREAEAGQLGGRVRFYPDALLESAGASVERAPNWQSNVVVDGLLITGQNPATHNAFGKAFVAALGAR